MTSLFLLSLMTPAALGQDLISYSDTWMDEETGLSEDPQETEFFIVGAGVVEITSDYYHTVDMQVTIKSPESRSITEQGSWTRNGEGTSLTVKAPIIMRIDPEPADTGNYDTLINIDPTCSGGGVPTSGGSTFPVGLSYAAFTRGNCTTYGCWFYRVDPCGVTCPNRARYFLGNGHQAGSCMYTITPYAPLIGCLGIHAVRGNVAACVCFDVGWN
ncbi:MAG: hypothetical protein M3384_20600 [Acidobacteriota bacterium]|nr:hypothetical protein [Acidobacteriota bacterium]